MARSDAPARSTDATRRHVGAWALGGAAILGTGAAGEYVWQARARTDALVDWPIGDAAAHGVDDTALERVRRELARHGTAAFLVARGDVLVREWYGVRVRDLARGRGVLRAPPSRRFAVASMAKAVLATTALLLCAGDGLVELDAPASRYLPGWGWDADPARAGITLRHLASHTSGLEDARREELTAGGVEDWERRFWREPESRPSIARRIAPLVHPAGRVLHYSNPGFAILEAVLGRVLHEAPGGGDARSLLRGRFFQPLGIPNAAWSMSYGRDDLVMDGYRIEELAGGCTMTARAVARVGHAYLRGGRPVLGPAAVADGLAPAADVTLPPDWRALRQPVPALGWWSNARGAWRSAPADTLVGAGAGDKLLVVIPSLDLVAVRLGGQLGLSAFGGDYWRVFEDMLLAPLVAAVR